MPDVAKTIRQWLGGRPNGEDSSQQEAARTKLQDHIDAELLEAFLQRDVSDEEYQMVIHHMNVCDVCREAIAVVLLAVDNPKAAAELVLERQRRNEEEPEPSWKPALRWTAFAFVILVLLATAVLVPKSKDPDSRVGRWLEEADKSVTRIIDMEPEPSSSATSSSSSSSSSSSTSVGAVFSSTYESVKPEATRRRTSGRVRQFGWDTGPAPYAGKVEPSFPYSEVEMFDDRPEASSASSAASPASGTAAPVAATPATASTPSTPRARRRLVIAESGQLRRTLDGGATWQNVIVARDTVFRSLALSGHTVWASGDGGALYRSADAAEHWQQVQLQYRGEPITDDLVAVGFADPQHGFIRAASGREWTTVDGGNKWVLDPTTAKPN